MFSLSFCKNFKTSFCSHFKHGDFLAKVYMCWHENRNDLRYFIKSFIRIRPMKSGKPFRWSLSLEVIASSEQSGLCILAFLESVTKPLGLFIVACNGGAAVDARDFGTLRFHTFVKLHCFVASIKDCKMEADFKLFISTLQQKYTTCWKIYKIINTAKIHNYLSCCSADTTNKSWKFL